ncbi:MAG: rhomboid family intramembrane serine protease [Burkholderiaceae bacterium]|nr:rhomboid family intramembrane serine protease [Burkholderiaceae bacterium]
MAIGALAQVFVVVAFGGPDVPVIGASAGVFAMLAGYAIVFPNRTVMLLIPPIPLPARVFVLLYGALELALGVTGTATGVAHFAHLGGMAGGWIAHRFGGRPPGDWRGRR